MDRELRDRTNSFVLLPQKYSFGNSHTSSYVDTPTCKQKRATASSSRDDRKLYGGSETSPWSTNDTDNAARSLRRNELENWKMRNGKTSQTYDDVRPNCSPTKTSVLWTVVSFSPIKKLLFLPGHSVRFWNFSQGPSQSFKMLFRKQAPMMQCKSGKSFGCSKSACKLFQENQNGSLPNTLKFPPIATISLGARDCKPFLHTFMCKMLKSQQQPSKWQIVEFLPIK